LNRPKWPRKTLDFSAVIDPEIGRFGGIPVTKTYTARPGLRCRSFEAKPATAGGWADTFYYDRGFSGGTMEGPRLQLLADSDL
jgi:hypothetical protein